MSTETSTEIVRCVWTESDVASIAEDHDIDPAVALERAQEWGKHIEETASSLISGLLTNVITEGQP